VLQEKTAGFAGGFFFILRFVRDCILEFRGGMEHERRPPAQ
jgi:hypothetical protein